MQGQIICQAMHHCKGFKGPALKLSRVQSIKGSCKTSLLDISERLQVSARFRNISQDCWCCVFFVQSVHVHLRAGRAVRWEREGGRWRGGMLTEAVPGSISNVYAGTRLAMYPIQRKWDARVIIRSSVRPLLRLSSLAGVHLPLHPKQQA